MVKAKENLIEFTLMKQLRKHYSLIPIVGCSLFGMGLSTFAIMRTLTRSPDVSINRRGNPKPYERLMNPDGKPVQYKYYSTLDYNKLPPTEKPTIVYI